MDDNIIDKILKNSENDYENIFQTCRFHDFCKPGINLVIEQGENQPLDWDDYLEFFRKHGADFAAFGLASPPSRADAGQQMPQTGQDATGGIPETLRDCGPS